MKKDRRILGMRNFKTSLVGFITGLPIIVIGVIEKDPTKIITGVSGLLLGLLAKDHNVTGKSSELN